MVTCAHGARPAIQKMLWRKGVAPGKEAVPAVVGFPLGVNLVLTITALGTVYCGLFPNRILDFVLQSNLLAR